VSDLIEEYSVIGDVVRFSEPLVAYLKEKIVEIVANRE